MQSSTCCSACCNCAGFRRHPGPQVRQRRAIRRAAEAVADHDPLYLSPTCREQGRRGMVEDDEIRARRNRASCPRLRSGPVIPRGRQIPHSTGRGRTCGAWRWAGARRRLVGRLEEHDAGIVKQFGGTGQFPEGYNDLMARRLHPLASGTSWLTCPRPPPSSQASNTVVISYIPKSCSPRASISCNPRLLFD